jgi:UDP:flavonoid glycosyltransferase YjiC (YdhE family)
MNSFLFVTWDGGGNVPPATGIASELRARGHEVRFLGHPAQRSSLEEAGFAFTPYEHSRPFCATDANSVPRVLSMFTDTGMGEDLVAATRSHPTDLVVVDCMLIGALSTCARNGIRYAVLEHLFDGYLRQGWLHGPMGIAARLKGLRPVRSWDSAAVALVASLPELDPGSVRRQPANLRYTGPVVDETGPRAWSDERPMILVSLSTYRFPGMARALQNILDATAPLDAQVVLTTGPVVAPEELNAPANAEVHRFVPHDQLMPRASLVVGHGGHSTTMRALAHDLPLVVMPMHPMLDQPTVGRQVEKAGAGRLVRKKATPESLRDVIAALVADGPHRIAAARLGAQIREGSGRTTAADLLESVVAAPAQRPSAPA